MDEVAIIMCIKEVADKWIDESVSLGEDRNLYSYHDDTLWKKVVDNSQPVTKTDKEDIDSLNLF